MNSEMDAHTSSLTRRLPDMLTWGGAVVASLSLLGMGLQTVYFLLSVFPEGAAVGMPAGWLVGIGAGIALALTGLAATNRKHEPAEERVEHPQSPARAA